MHLNSQLKLVPANHRPRGTGEELSCSDIKFQHKVLEISYGAHTH